MIRRTDMHAPGVRLLWRQTPTEWPDSNHLAPLHDPHLITVSLADLLILAAAVALVAPMLPVRRGPRGGTRRPGGAPAPTLPRPHRHRIRTRHKRR